jgi:hypothetical protein
MQRPVIKKLGHDVGMHIVLVALGAAGVVLVILCTSRYGAGISPDSASYLSASQSLLRGEGYRYFDGGIYAKWPPLFPTLLAALNVVGLEPVAGARFLNAFAFGMIVYVSGRLFLRCTTSVAFALPGTLSIILSAPLVAVSIMVWSEPVFVALAALFTLAIPGFLRTQSRTSLVSISLLAALASLQRYAGVTLILSGCILIMLGASGASIGRRIRYAAAFSLLSGLPLAAWCLRNRLLAGQTAGGHHFSLTSGLSLGRPFASAMDLIAAWFFPGTLSTTAGWIGVGLVLVLSGAAIAVSHYALKRHNDTRLLQIWSAVVFGLAYLGFMVVSGAGLFWNLESRHMAPAYVFIMLLVFAGVEDVSELLGRLPTGRRLGALAGFTLCALWLLPPLGQMSADVKRYMDEGAGAYATRLWQESSLIAWLRANPLQGAIYSNVPDALYVLTGTSARTTPQCYEDVAKFAGTMSPSQANYIVWSSSLRRDLLYDVRELGSRWQMSPVATLTDGAVYRFLGNRGSGVSGVYRFWSPDTGRHFYTADKRERDDLSIRHARDWKDEGVVFYVYREGQQPADALPVHRLWSNVLQTRFYTIDEAEKNKLAQDPSGAWKYEGVVWYAYPEGRHPAETLPVHRFWSDALGSHFYTIDKAEKDKLIQDYAHVWKYEGVVWYAFGK